MTFIVFLAPNPTLNTVIWNPMSYRLTLWPRASHRPPPPPETLKHPEPPETLEQPLQLTTPWDSSGNGPLDSVCKSRPNPSVDRGSLTAQTQGSLRSKQWRKKPWGVVGSNGIKGTVGRIGWLKLAKGRLGEIVGGLSVIAKGWQQWRAEEWRRWQRLKI